MWGWCICQQTKGKDVSREKPIGCERLSERVLRARIGGSGFQRRNRGFEGCFGGVLGAGWRARREADWEVIRRRRKEDAKHPIQASGAQAERARGGVRFGGESSRGKVAWVFGQHPPGVGALLTLYKFAIWVYEGVWGGVWFLWERGWVVLCGCWYVAGMGVMLFYCGLFGYIDFYIYLCVTFEANLFEGVNFSYVIQNWYCREIGPIFLREHTH